MSETSSVYSAFVTLRHLSTAPIQKGVEPMLNLPHYKTAPNLAPQNPKVSYPTKPPLTPNYTRLPKGNGRPRFIFSQDAISNLSPSDQHLFEKLGQGPVVELPYNAIHHPFEAYAAANPSTAPLQSAALS